MKIQKMHLSSRFVQWFLASLFLLALTVFLLLFFAQESIRLGSRALSAGDGFSAVMKPVPPDLSDMSVPAVQSRELDKLQAESQKKIVKNGRAHEQKTLEEQGQQLDSLREQFVRKQK